MINTNFKYGLLLIIICLLSQCKVKTPTVINEKWDCSSIDSLYSKMIDIDFKSYQKRDFKYLLEETDLKDHKSVHFVAENSCLISIYFEFGKGMSVKVEINSFKKLKRCVKQYSEWRLEDAKEETFDKITIFNSCDSDNFQHFIYDANEVKKEGN